MWDSPLLSSPLVCALGRALDWYSWLYEELIKTVRNADVAVHLSGSLEITQSCCQEVGDVGTSRYSERRMVVLSPSNVKAKFAGTQ